MDREPCVYLLARASHSTFYTGVTSDLIQRMHQHRTGAFGGFTAHWGIKRLVWFEMHADMAIRVNDFLAGLFAGIGIRLVDFKLEFGRVWENDYARIILADEISPDGCRLWDMRSGEKLDKDRFRQNLGGEAEAYQEVARRLGLLEGQDGENAVLDLESHRKKRGK